MWHMVCVKSWQQVNLALDALPYSNPSSATLQDCSVSELCSLNSRPLRHVLVIAQQTSPSELWSAAYHCQYTNQICSEADTVYVTTLYVGVQIKTLHPLAVTYNDQSPLENHHHAAAVRLLLQPEYRYLPVSGHMLSNMYMHKPVSQ